MIENAGPAGTGSMSNPRQFRYVAVALLLVALLVVATTAGNLWHNHRGSSETNCPICHLSHQPIERPLAAVRAPVLALLGAPPEPRDPGFVPAPFSQRVPARAPPTA